MSKGTELEYADDITLFRAFSGKLLLSFCDGLMRFKVLENFVFKLFAIDFCLKTKIRSVLCLFPELSW